MRRMPNEIPWWAKTVAYIGIGAGAIYGGYLIVNQFLNPAQHTIDKLTYLAQKQQEEINRELKEYALAGTLGNPQQQDAIEAKKPILQDLLDDIDKTTDAAMRNSIIGYIATAGLLALGISAWVTTKYWSRAKNARTPEGLTYVAVCAISEDLQIKGYVTEAVSLKTTMQRQFQLVDSIYMQTQISMFQAQLPILQGWELLNAQNMIVAYTYELNIIPQLFSLIPIPLALSKPSCCGGGSVLEI